MEELQPKIVSRHDTKIATPKREAGQEKQNTPPANDTVNANSTDGNDAVTAVTLEKVGENDNSKNQKAHAENF